MRSSALLLACLLVAPLPAAAATSVAEAWLRVQEELSVPTPTALDERIAALEQAASDVDARRLTPYAEALAAWAEAKPGAQAEAVLRHARRIDPELPAPSFLLARWRWEAGAYLSAVGPYLVGWFDLVRNGESRRSVAFVLALWLLLTVGTAVGLSAVLQTLSRIRLLGHDAWELGRHLFNPVNAYVFVAVVLALPVFAALGPLWLVAYLFALSWSYLGRSELAAAVTSCALLALLTPVLETWQRAALRAQPVSTRVGSMLQERRIDPSTLREFIDLAAELQGIARYQLILGELLRMHGDVVAAGEAFQRAVVADPGAPEPLVFLGNLAMEDGDVPRAIQHYSAAVGLDDRCAFAYLNLAVAFDQTYRFREGDEARLKARDLAGSRVSTLGVGGRMPRVRYPSLGRADVSALLAEVTPETRLGASLASPRRHFLPLMLNPLSAVFWASGLLGAGMVLVRRRWGSSAVACARCGRVFCSHCKTSTESWSYCSQCISVFLKRDLVSVEQQAVKMAQVRRWETLSRLARNLAASVVPGAGSVLSGRVWTGLAMGALAWFCVLGAAVFLPRFLPALEPQASAAPLQGVLLVGAVLLWGRSALTAWRGR